MRVMTDNYEPQEIHNDIQTINNWWKEFTSHLYRKKRLIYCLEIDGVQMFNGYESFIVENHEDINQIHIHTKSHQESIQETFQVMGNYLETFIPKSLALADCFYGEVSESQWDEFSQFIDGLNWIVSSLEFIQSISDSVNDDIKLVLAELEPVIANLEQSIQNDEHVEMADLIKYELIPIIEPVQQMCVIQ
ncbi:hypothetical protein ACM1RC_20875 [Paenibacillus azoreducens]|uniref:hypothetical protein n=1 Tax=Paenibacillus azoreducens TaxID=116718 RepID=UPI0039F62A2D